MKKLLLVTAIALALSACGGSGGGSDSKDEPKGKPPVVDKPAPIFENPVISGYFERQVGYEDKTESYRFSGNEYDYRTWCWEPRDCAEYTEYGTVEYREELISTSGNIVRKIMFFRELVNGKDNQNVTRKTYSYRDDQVVFGDNFGGSINWDNPYWKQ